MSLQAHTLIEDVRTGSIDTAWRNAGGEWQPACDDSLHTDESIAGLLSGSFNPLHDGHRGLRTASELSLAGPVAYELPLVNADKPALEVSEVQRRCQQFTSPVVITRAATFVEKSRLFPGATFVIGLDTALRVIDPRFQEGDTERLSAALDEIADRGCSFLVAARHQKGQLLTLADLPLPGSHAPLFRAIPTIEFCLNVSSTSLRNSSSHQ